MRALVVPQPGSLKFGDVAEPHPARGEVLVSVKESGICGTDLHIIGGGHPEVSYPIIPGHESWGRVEAIGNDVIDVRVGDTVSIEPTLTDGVCFECRRYRQNLCHQHGAIGVTRGGGWAERLVAPRPLVHVLEASYPMEGAAMIEPVACALHGLDRLAPVHGQSALIFGAGTVGILLAVGLELSGVGPITIVEPGPVRRLTAQQLTAARVCDPEDLSETFLADLVIDATGRPDVMQRAIDFVAPAGKVMLYGVAEPSDRIWFSPLDLYAKEFTILSSRAILHTYGRAVDWVRTHHLRVAPIVTHRFGLDEHEQALRTHREGGGVKVVFTPG